MTPTLSWLVASEVVVTATSDATSDDKVVIMTNLGFQECLWLSIVCIPSTLQFHHTWWRHQMETFSAFLAICAGNSPGTGEFPAQRPVTRSYDAFFDLRLNKRLSKQSRGWWFETLLRPLWRHCNDRGTLLVIHHPQLEPTPPFGPYYRR